MKFRYRHQRVSKISLETWIKRVCNIYVTENTNIIFRETIRKIIYLSLSFSEILYTFYISHKSLLVFVAYS